MVKDQYRHVHESLVITRMLAAELRSERFLVNAVCPGWVP